jgi:cardiolipin synthase
MVAVVATITELSGCASLPPISVDTQQAAGQPATLSGGRGPLSAAQSKAILANLSRRSEETGIFEHHLALEEAVTGSPLVISNRTTLYQDGESTYAAMFKAIAAAKDHINIETYIIEDDEIGKKFSDALIAKQAAGVQVTMIYDSVGSLQTPKAFFQRLNENGIKTLEFNPVNPLLAKKDWEINQRDHRKLLITDGQSVFLGGVNLSSVYSSGSSAKRKASKNTTDMTPWRDTHLLVEGPVVAEFQKLFIDTWVKQKGEALADRKYFPPLVQKGKEVVRAIGSSSDDAGGGQMYNTLISVINSAETSAYITNAYFAPDKLIMDALRDAAQRGVDVKIILPGETDSALIYYAGHSYYSDLLKAGVKIFERRVSLLHAKTALIDGVWSTIGSTNLDWRSFLHNDEINAVVLGIEFGVQMKMMFDKDLVESDAITLAHWRERSLMDRVKEQAARIWVYWL